MSKTFNHNIYEFEGFRLDAAHLLLFKGEEELPLAPKVVETLLALVERGGEIVSKEELMQRVWADSCVEESNLSQNLYRLRRTLGDTPDGKPFIETLRRRGYRFIPQVKISNAKVEPIIQELSSFYRDEFTHEDHFSEQIETDLPPRAAAHRVTSHYDARFITALGIIFIFLIVLSGFAIKANFGVKPAQSANLILQKLTQKGHLRGAAISPDGNSLVFVTYTENKHSLHLRNIQTESEVTLIEPTEKVIGSLRFAPDGNFIYVNFANEIVQTPVFGGEQKKIAANLWSNFSVSPDGKYIAFPRSDPTKKITSLVLAATDGSGERVISERAAPRMFALWGPAPAFSLDGENLSAVVHESGDDEMKVVNVNLQSGEESDLKTDSTFEYIDYIDWKNQTELLISAKHKDADNAQIWSVKYPEGAVEPVTRDFNNYTDFTLSSDKKKMIAIQESENLHLWIVDSMTGAARQLTSGVSRTDGRFGLAFAPDGSVIFTAREKKNYEIFSINQDGSELRQLTENFGQNNSDPVVSPDNQHIVFISDKTGSERLWMMNSDGSGARLLTDFPERKEISEDAPYFSADGKWIYYVFYEDGKGTIRKVPSEGGTSELVSRTDKNVFEPVPSPDEKFLAHAVYNENSSKPFQIAVQNLDDSRAPERYFEFPAFRLRIRWLLDSKTIVSIDDKTGAHNLWQTNLFDGTRKPITNFKGEKIYRFDVSHDRRSYVVALGNYFYDAVLIER